MYNYSTKDVIGFAEKELNKYLSLIKVTADIKLGIFSKFGISKELRDPFWDDAFVIDVKTKKA